ncbi:hypothetical protein H0H92_011526 [Tricholoma furcatifolium]|nr:hypothetical protein H0H92_011526 [Tricholoma furcatifolium]
MTPSAELINFVSVMCESVLVGAYAVLIGLLFHILSTNRRPFSVMYRVLLLASITMFLISVVHLGLVMQQVSVQDAPLANLHSQIVLSAIQPISAFIIDIYVIILKVWVIWGQNYMVAVGPLVMMVVATGLTFTLTALDETSSYFNTVPVALIVGNTTICSLLIVGRIWYVHRQVRKSAGSIGIIHISNGYKGAWILIIESGVLYALTQICILIVGRTDSAALPIILNIEVPLIGILSTLIIILIHFNMVPWRTPSNISAIPSATRRWSETSNASTSTSTVNSESKAETASVCSDTSSEAGGSSSKVHAGFSYNYRLEDAEATLAADFPPLPPSRYIVRDVNHFVIDV